MRMFGVRGEILGSFARVLRSTTSEVCGARIIALFTRARYDHSLTVERMQSTYTLANLRIPYGGVPRGCIAESPWPLGRRVVEGMATNPQKPPITCFSGVGLKHARRILARSHSTSIGGFRLRVINPVTSVSSTSGRATPSSALRAQQVASYRSCDPLPGGIPRRGIKTKVKTKVKPWSSWKRRFRITSSGAFQRKQKGKRHKAFSKSPQQRMRLRATRLVHASLVKPMRKLGFKLRS